MKKPRETKRSSDEAVKAKTGKVWAEWFKILDKAGAKKMAAQGNCGLSKGKTESAVAGGARWSRWDTSTSADCARNFRNATASSARGGSRTMAVPLAKAFAAWTDEKLRKRWLPDAKLEITTATPGKYVRGKWDDARG